MENKIKKIKNALKYLGEHNLSTLDLQVYVEIMSQLKEDGLEVNDEILGKIFTLVFNAYLKSEDARLSDIVDYCIVNIADIDNINIWKILCCI